MKKELILTSLIFASPVLGEDILSYAKECDVIGEGVQFDLLTRAVPKRQVNPLAKEPHKHGPQRKLTQEKKEIEKRVETPYIYAPGTRLALTAVEMPGLAGFDHLLATVEIIEGGQKIVVARSSKEALYDMIFLDRDLDGDLKDESPTTIKLTESRGITWLRHSESLTVAHTSAGIEGKRVEMDFPVKFWMVQENDGETPDVIRYTSNIFSTGDVVIDGVKYNVMAREWDKDGLMTEMDWWKMKKADDKWSAHMRPASEFRWVNGKAWKIRFLDTEGTSAEVFEVAPKVSEAEYNAKMNRARSVNPALAADKSAERAKTPVVFSEDYTSAIKQAQATNQPVLLKFETSWCGPCKLMNQNVFTAKQIVEDAQGVLCVKIDGDQNRDLVKKYGIKGYPTIVMLTREGEESRRVSGYQSIQNVSQLLKAAKK